MSFAESKGAIMNNIDSDIRKKIELRIAELEKEVQNYIGRGYVK
jgi:hypothetical protein